MELKGKVVLFARGRTKVDVFDAVTGQVVQQHDAQGTLGIFAVVQKNIAAMAVSAPQQGVHVIDVVSGKILCKFILPNGEDACVTLSKDAFTLGIGNSIGLSVMIVMIVLSLFSCTLRPLVHPETRP